MGLLLPAGPGCPEAGLTLELVIRNQYITVSKMRTVLQACIPSSQRLRREVREFKANLGYIVPG